MDHPSPDTGSRLRVVVLAAITVWLFGSGLLWIAGFGGGGGADDHHQTVLVTNLRVAAMQAAVVLFVVGPLAIAVLEFLLGKRFAGVVFLAIGAGLAALLLRSDTIIGLFQW